VKFRPRQDYLLVRPIERKQSDIIAVVSNEKHCLGEIVAVGPGKRDKRGNLRPLDSVVGQIVTFGNGEFDFYPKLELDGVIYRVIQEADICWVVETALAA
jgi:chaperonin GroES